jgi:DNA modification methylase
MTPSTTCLLGDCREILPSLAFLDVQFDACVTDPPYGIGHWDWIEGDELHFHEQWARAVYSVLKPGAHSLVFAGVGHWTEAGMGTDPRLSSSYE